MVITESVHQFSRLNNHWLSLSFQLFAIIQNQFLEKRLAASLKINNVIEKKYRFLILLQSVEVYPGQMESQIFIS